jgi:hypothetical protein
MWPESFRFDLQNDHAKVVTVAGILEPTLVA